MGDGLLVDGLAVVEVELSRSRAIGVKRDEKLKVLLAELGGGVCGLDAEGENHTAANEERDGRGVDAGDEVVCSAAGNLGVGVPVVEDVVGEIDADAGGALRSDGGDNQAWAEEVLELQGPGGRVVGVLEEHRGDCWLAIGGVAVHGSIDVVEQAVTDVNGLAGAAGHGRPAVKLLANVAQVVVVAVECAESAEGGPSSAELFVCVAAEATDIRTDHAELEEGGECQHGADGDGVVAPLRLVVSEPVADL